MGWFTTAATICSTFTPLPDITAYELAVIVQKSNAHVLVCYHDCKQYLEIPSNVRRHLPLNEGKTCP